MNAIRKQERIKFLNEQILLLRGFLSNPDSLVTGTSLDGMSESWANRADIQKELKAYENELDRLTSRGGGRIRYADTRRVAGR